MKEDTMRKRFEQYLTMTYGDKSFPTLKRLSYDEASFTRFKQLSKEFERELKLTNRVSKHFVRDLVRSQKTDYQVARKVSKILKEQHNIDISYQELRSSRYQLTNPELIAAIEEETDRMRTLGYGWKLIETAISAVFFGS